MSFMFELDKGWQGYDDLASRRSYLIELVEHFSQKQIVKAKLKPGGFNEKASHLFWPNHTNKAKVNFIKKIHAEVHDQLRKLPDNIVFKSAQWNLLEQYLRILSREFKIHLQPQEEKIPLVMARLLQIISTDQFLLDNLLGLKVTALFPEKCLEYNRAVIVIYLDFKKKRQGARFACQQFLTELKTGLADYEKYAEGRLPVYNYPVTDLISFIQIGTDLKFDLEDILGQRRFDKLFPKKYYQAILMDEDPQFLLPQPKRRKRKKIIYTPE